jgi:hypothetical protein
MSSSMGIILVSISVHDYLSSRATKETPNALFHRSYFMPKKGDIAYDQQCDTIFKLENLQLQVLLVTPKDKTFFHAFVKK